MNIKKILLQKIALLGCSEVLFLHFLFLDFHPILLDRETVSIIISADAGLVMDTERKVDTNSDRVKKKLCVKKAINRCK